MVRRGRLVTIPGLDGPGLTAAVVDEVSELVAVLDAAGCVVAVNTNLADELRCEPETLLGRTALDLLDPPDHDRALLMLDVTNDRGAPPGTASFGLRRGDGSVVPTHLTGCDTWLDGVRYFAVVGRPSYMLGAVERLLDNLLGGADLGAVMAPIIEFFAWRENDSRVAISWWDGLDLQAVSTGLPPALSGLDGSSEGPWARARRSGERIDLDVADLAGEVRELAEAAGLHHVRIQPVAPARLEVPALITVWTSMPGLPPAIHSFGVATAERYVEMVLRWSDQVARLDAAAHHDPLTDLANRRAFFDTLAGDGRGGSVLYCDLDGFKAVNDRWGHTAGDGLLREVARRILAEVRDDDLVARIGGDEFGVLLWGVDEVVAESVAERLRAACRTPVWLPGLDEPIEVGISVGVASDVAALAAHTVERADAALYREKRRTRGPS